MSANAKPGSPRRLAVAIAGALLAACTTPGAQVTPPDPKVMPFTATSCPNDGNDKCRVTLQLRINKKKNRCVVEDDDVLKIKMAKNKNNVKMIWLLEDMVTAGTLATNFQFCPATGDGVSLKESEDNPADRQMTEMGSSDANGNLDPNATQDCKKRFRWHNKNKNTERYDYQLRFQDTNSGVVCVIDPWIKNGQ